MIEKPSATDKLLVPTDKLSATTEKSPVPTDTEPRQTEKLPGATETIVSGPFTADSLAVPVGSPARYWRYFALYWW